MPTIAITSFPANPSPFTSIGQNVTLTVNLSNTGNVALTNVAVTYSGANSATTCPTSLAIGATATCTATHVTTTTDSASNFTVTATASGKYSTTTVTNSASTTVPSAVPCTVLTATNTSIGNPSSVARVASGNFKSYLVSDVVVTVQGTALCSGLRIKYYTSSQSAVTANMSNPSAGTWTFTIPGQGSTGATTWSKGAAQVDILPAASVGSTAIYSNAAAFTVSS